MPEKRVVVCDTYRAWRIAGPSFSVDTDCLVVKIGIRMSRVVTTLATRLVIATERNIGKKPGCPIPGVWEMQRAQRHQHRAITGPRLSE